MNRHGHMEPMLGESMPVYPGCENQTAGCAPIDRASLETYWHSMNPEGLSDCSLPSKGTDLKWPQSIADRSSEVWCFHGEPLHGQWANYIATDGSDRMRRVWSCDVLAPIPSRQGLSFVSEYPSSQAALFSAPESM
jgi:hypothetical protein